jgi:hypothetical protein
LRCLSAGNQPQPCPVVKIVNPNVAIELGYALHVLTDRAFLSSTGHAPIFPSTFNQAGPITFNLPPDATKQAMEAARHSLKTKLLEAVKLCHGSAGVHRSRIKGRCVMLLPSSRSLAF